MDDFQRLPGPERQYTRQLSGGGVGVYSRREVDKARRDSSYIPTPLRVIPSEQTSQPVQAKKVGRGGRQRKEELSRRGIGGGTPPDFPIQIADQSFPVAKTHHQVFDITPWSQDDDRLGRELQRLAGAIPGQRWFIGVDYDDPNTGNESQAMSPVRKKGDVVALLAQLKKLKAKTYTTSITKIWVRIVEKDRP